ncbi:MAG: hypothetical protein AAF830_08665 [Pseudomonadota bacterium]
MRLLKVMAAASVAALMGSSAMAANLVVNGDFEAGNTGFGSEFTFNTSNFAAGEYGIVTNPRAWNGNFRIFGDHTTGTSNMMIINGSQGTDDVVWSQTIAVTQNTDYDFSLWVQSAFSGSSDNQVRINGVDVGDVFADSFLDDWTFVTRQWNSGSATSAFIEIINLATGFGGNDFAFDDISFVGGSTAPVPVPAAALLFAPLAAVAAMRHRKG